MSISNVLAFAYFGNDPMPVFNVADESGKTFCRLARQPPTGWIDVRLSISDFFISLLNQKHVPTFCFILSVAIDISQNNYL